jgi:hypothetical protein
MNRVRLAFAVACLVAGAALPLAAQNLGDLDGDGVPNPQDRCPNTPRGVRVDANGCPVAGAAAAPGARPPTVTGGAPTQQAGAPSAPAAGAPSGKQGRPSPTLVTNPANPAAGQPAAPGQAPAAGAQPGAALVTPQAAVTPPAGAAPPAAAGAFTAGLAMQPFSGTTVAQRLEYGRTLARNLDSAIVTLVTVFRNTTGQPMSGATAPTALSARERERWARCRDLHFDLSSYVGGVDGFLEGLEDNPGLERAASALDSVLSAVDATVECDNVSSMIAAPDRWDPWAQQYSTSARRFYANWYTQVRDVHEKDRAFVMALNAALPAGRALPVPSGLPRNPPYAGASVR